MKRLSLSVLILGAAVIGSGFMFPEDRLPKKYWQDLSPKEKHVFLMGYRVAAGPNDKVAGMPEVAPGFLVLGEKHFDELIALVDGFYREPKNENVRVGGAIEIAIMKMQKKDTEEIEKKIEAERSLIYTSF